MDENAYSILSLDKIISCNETQSFNQSLASGNIDGNITVGNTTAGNSISGNSTMATRPRASIVFPVSFFTTGVVG